jgi:hypothetical protein
MNHWQKFLIVFLIISVIIGIGTILWWESGTYKVDALSLIEVKEDKDFTLNDTTNSVELVNLKGTNDLEIVYFPGAKVDPASYLKRLQKLARLSSIKKVIVLKSPFHFALLSNGYTVKDPAKTILMGHSVGGVAACEVAKKFTVKALVLEASYCNGGGDMDEPVIGVYGTEDGLQSVEKVEGELLKIKSTKLEKIKIEGLNHANFGWYGKQSGDKEASKNHDESDSEIVSKLVNFLI